MPAPTTFQQIIAGLAAIPDDGVRGLRFCFGREADSQAGAFVSWPRFARRIHGVAQRLLDVGVQGGDVIAVHVHDQQLALLTMLASMHLGAIPTALAPTGAGTASRLVEQFHAIVAVAQPRVLVLDRELDAVVTTHAAPLPTTMILNDLPEAEPVAPLRVSAPDDPCFLQFTSGSTSVPKGVVVTHRMLLTNVDSMSAVLDWGPQGRCVGWLPIYHDMSMVGLYAMAVRHAARGCFFPTSRFGRSPDLWLRLLAEERAHFSAGPNFAFAMVVRMAARRPITGIDLSAFRGIICGSEPIAAGVMRDFAALTAPLGMPPPAIPAFGMAESTLMATCCAPGAPLHVTVVDRAELERTGQVRVVDAAANADDDHEQSTSLALVGCGPPGPGTQVAIEREHQLVGEDLVGEVLLAGPSVLSRYWRNEAATAAAFVDHAGTRWYRTGDLGFFHAGHLHLCGRAKDMIIHNGVNYYPADVEAALPRALPNAVRLAAVVDLRHDIAAPFRGLGVLFEINHGAASAAEAEAAVAAFVTEYTGLPVARALALASGCHIPRTTSGKLMRPAIRRVLLDSEGSAL